MDKPESKDKAKAGTDAKKKATSALDDILGGSDFGLDLNLDLDMDDFLGTAASKTPSPTPPPITTTPTAQEDTTPATPAKSETTTTKETKEPADTQTEATETQAPDTPDVTDTSETSETSETSNAPDASDSDAQVPPDTVEAASTEEEPSTEANPTPTPEETSEPEATSAPEAAPATTPEPEVLNASAKDEFSEEPGLSIQSVPPKSQTIELEETDAVESTPEKLSLEVGGPPLHTTTIELDAADEIKESTPPPPPPKAKKGSIPPPPPSKAKESTPPPPPPKAKKGSAFATIELDMSDAVVEQANLERIKANIIENTQSSADVLVSPERIQQAVQEAEETSTKASLPSPPADQLKEVLDVPSPHMPPPPNELNHEVQLPVATLPPPPAGLKVLGDQNKQEETPEIDANEEAKATEIPNESNEHNEEAPTNPPIFDVGADYAASSAAPVAQSFADAFADSVSSSKSELAAITTTPNPTPASAPPENELKSTQLYGAELGASVQRELEKIAQEKVAQQQANEVQKQAEKPEDVIFPPAQTATPATGTDDFAAVDVGPKPGTPKTETATDSKDKPANPLMQTALYGNDMAEVQELLLKQQEAKEKAEAEAEANENTEADTPPKKETSTAFQTQLYGKDDVAAVAKQLKEEKASEATPNSTVVSMEAASSQPEEARPALRVQLDPTSKDAERNRPQDSLFDDPSGAEAVQQVIRQQQVAEQEAKAEKAVKEGLLVNAIRIYHNLQQTFPNEARYDARLRELVALQKKRANQPAPSAQPASQAQTNQAASQPQSARPPAQAARTKAQKPTSQFNALNIILLVLVLVLGGVLVTGLVWPGWLKRKPAVEKKQPTKIRPLVPAERKK